MAKGTKIKSGTTGLSGELSCRFSLGAIRLDLGAAHPAANHEAMRLLIAEAYRCGAGLSDAIDLVDAWFEDREDSQTTDCDESGSGFSSLRLTISLDADGTTKSSALDAVRDEWMRHQSQVSGEFDALEPGVRAAFNFDKSAGALAYYTKMRAVYYCHGYSDPAGQILADIDLRATLLGKKIAGGVHKKMAAAFQKVETYLNAKSPDLVKQVASTMTSIGGFVPRFIARRQGQTGAPHLSNHAFGLAVDIDPSSNPHIKDKTVIAELNEIARGSGFDFGGRYAEIKGSKDVRATHHAAQDASDRVRKFLDEWLDRYIEILRESSGDEAREVANAASGSKLNEKSFIAQLASRQKGIGKSAPVVDCKPGPDQCEPLPHRTLTAMARLWRITGFHAVSDLVTWRKKGIQTIDVELAVAMVEAGMRWGTTYTDSKDMMHFELLASKAVAPPEGPKSLEELFPVRRRECPRGLSLLRGSKCKC
jgi:D-alanyl-D-alanine carboxypeptidase